MTREETIDEEGVDGNYEGWKDGIQGKCKRDWDPLVHGVRILECVVAEGEALMIWFDSIKSSESEEQDPRLKSASSAGQAWDQSSGRLTR